MNSKIQKIKEAVEKELSCSAHNMDHVMRVYRNCLSIAKNKDVDMEVLQAAAILHDIGAVKEMHDNTGNTDHAMIGAEMAEPILKELGFSDDKIKHVKDCIISHRYKTENKPKTKEAEILFDADKIDALGAIGIARSFSWVGKNNANIYRKVNIEEYAKENLTDGKINGRIIDKTKHSPQIEFEIKGKFLIDKLYTKKAKEIAKERIKFFKNFLDRMEREINGEL
ncbi:MAG: HD domain-containing protein [Nanoarchaeota archaeon]|nr:HD domain-containing protein [Nanoarchaeota archaeon]MBU1135631.1 HD domain-containing protein [Nanoarchaeota archaeon]MBU2519996.1 HD domain-containing protein [Nanoarchaeota archaeon]